MFSRWWGFLTGAGPGDFRSDFWFSRLLVCEKRGGGGAGISIKRGGPGGSVLGNPPPRFGAFGGAGPLGAGLEKGVVTVSFPPGGRGKKKPTDWLKFFRQFPFV